MKFVILSAVCCIAGILCSAIGQEAPKPPKPPVFILSKDEGVAKALLQTQFQLIQTQLQLSLRNHQDQVNQFVADTLKAHGNPSNVHWNPQSYEFETDAGPKAPAVSSPGSSGAGEGDIKSQPPQEIPKKPDAKPPVKP